MRKSNNSVGGGVFTCLFMIIILVSAIALPLFELHSGTTTIHQIFGQIDTNSSSNPQTFQLDLVDVAKILADNLENRLNKSTAILELTGSLPEVRNFSFADQINETLHGIPELGDMAKRRIAQHILSTYDDFSAVFFVMPNGDVYMVEPYSRQENLTTSNLAFRDYYKGAISTGSPYLSDVIISLSSGRPQANLVIPLYAHNEDEVEGNDSSSYGSSGGQEQGLIGIWGGSLDFRVYDHLLQSLDLGSDNDDNNTDVRFVLLDRNGTKIADSDKSHERLSPSPNKTTLEEEKSMFASLQGFRNAVTGKSGYIVEGVDGMEMVISYHPIKAVQSTWVLIGMKTPSPSS